MAIGSPQNKSDQQNSQLISVSRRSYPKKTLNQPHVPCKKPQKLTHNIVNAYRNTIKPRYKDIGLFTDSIPKGTNMKIFNSSLRGSRAYLGTLLGAKSTQLNHYVRPTLLQ